MRKIIFSPAADKEFAGLDGSVKLIFAKHIKKLEIHLPQHYLQSGERYAIEEIGQGRIVCQVNGDAITLLHMFTTHKEYEKWYRSLF